MTNIKILYTSALLWLLHLSYLSNSVTANEEIIPTKFKTCQERGACHRNIHYSRAISNLKPDNFFLEPKYSIDPQSLLFGDQSSNIDSPAHVLSGTITKKFISIEQANNYKNYLETLDDQSTFEAVDMGKYTSTVDYPFYLDFSSFDDHVFRFVMEEERSRESKPALPDYLEINRFNGTSKFAFRDQDYFDNVSSSDYQIYLHETEESLHEFNQPGHIEIKYKKDLKIEISLEDFEIFVHYKNKQIVTVNKNNFLNIEQLKKVSEIKKKTSPLESTYGSFQIENTKDYDSLPFGPESVAVDFTFNGISNVYGLPEHADSLRLRDTSNTEPYRLFNADSFMYEPYSTAPLYGSIPFMFGMNSEIAAGIFWINAADTDIKINYLDNSTLSHWISEAGILDFVVFVGNEPRDIIESFTNITGTVALPPVSALGYHQCRWNYDTQSDVLNVDALMETHNIPYDYIWLDIEYTDAKKYFTWDELTFPDPHALLAKLDENGRNLVTIIDPHIKVDYFASDKMVEGSCTVKDKFMNPFKGDCWPGESYWIDTFDPQGVSTWTELYRDFVDNEYHNLQFWNDMNEPSVFGGPELTFPLDNIHHGGFEHRALHNLYGMSVHEATFQVLREVYGNTRPFILTRSFFAGSQRSTAIWTGDNKATWAHLKASLPMIMSLNVAGMPFVGADVGGFFDHPSNELMVRWNQAGLFYPFFRGHAHIDNPRREPYLFESPYREYITEAIQLRYQLLPTIYNEFYKSHVSGSPILAPLFYRHPELENYYNVDDQFYLGGMLVKPITAEGAESTTVIFPSENNVYYKYETFEIYEGGNSVEVDAPLNSIPLFIEGGNVIFTKTRVRKSTFGMKNDPYTIAVAPNKQGVSKGSLYVDDGETYDFENKNDYLIFEVSLENNILKSTVTNQNDKFNQVIEKIVIPNVLYKKATLVTKEDSHIELKIKNNGNFITVENPGITTSEEWIIEFS